MLPKMFLLVTFPFYQGPSGHGTESQPQSMPSSNTGGSSTGAAGSPQPCDQGLNADEHLEYVSSARFIPPLPSKVRVCGKLELTACLISICVFEGLSLSSE